MSSELIEAQKILDEQDDKLEEQDQMIKTLDEEVNKKESVQIQMKVSEQSETVLDLSK